MRRLNSTTRRSLCVCNAAWFCGDALAADPASAADSTLAEVIVTGTRLTVKQSDSTVPVTVLDRRDVERSGADSAAKILRTLPMNTGSPNGTNVNNGGDGAARVDLRGLGSQRTLVLLNGRRFPNGGVGGDALGRSQHAARFLDRAHRSARERRLGRVRRRRRGRRRERDHAHLLSRALNSAADGRSLSEATARSFAATRWSVSICSEDPGASASTIRSRTA